MIMANAKAAKVHSGVNIGLIVNGSLPSVENIVFERYSGWMKLERMLAMA